MEVFYVKKPKNPAKNSQKGGNMSKKDAEKEKINKILRNLDQLSLLNAIKEGKKAVENMNLEDTLAFKQRIAGRLDVAIKKTYQLRLFMLGIEGQIKDIRNKDQA